ncbi:restriction endonuclease [Streptomyces rimosus]|uniref:restriction endonuclease n=1 Tax=Streptomyces rimosus TaxID=1927 RepID=UPI00131E814E|nr:restriction endonuclease [Streptomyces rimosus]
MSSMVARADLDDMTAAFLWVMEGQLTLDICKHLQSHRDWVQREFDHAAKRSDEAWSAIPLPTDFGEIAGDTWGSLQKELDQAERAYKSATDALHMMREDYGDIARIRERYIHDAESVPPPLESLIGLWHAYLDADHRVRQVIAKDRDRTHSAALLEVERQIFCEGPECISMYHIDRMHHTEFERTVAELVRRDGYTLERARGGAGDLGADVIAVAPGTATRFIFQCKHTRTDATVGSPALQRLNGTARQVHRADVVVIVTNGSFSSPAQAFARSQNISLIGRSGLIDWASWGVPLQEILERHPLLSS